MRWEQLRPRLVLGATIVALIAVGVARYRYVTKLPGVRALAQSAPERILYYRVDASHEPAFLLSGAQRNFRLFTHQLISDSAAGMPFDPAQSYAYALNLSLVDRQGRRLWQTTLREDSRQTKVLGKDGRWRDETAYLEGRRQAVTDPRTSIVQIPGELPAGARLVAAPVDPKAPAVLLRAYALSGSPRQELHAKLARNPELALEGLSFLRAKELVPKQAFADPSESAERMIAQDDSVGHAEVVPMFVRKSRRAAPALKTVPRRWVAGPWERSLMVKGPGALEAELLFEKSEAMLPCPEGELVIEQIDVQNQRQHRRYALALDSAGPTNPRRCVSGRVELELGEELRDLRMRWKPRLGTSAQARMHVRLWAKEAPIELLSREGWTTVAPFEEIHEVPSLRMESEILGNAPEKVLRYDVTPGAGKTREVDLSIRRFSQAGLMPPQIEAGELRWTFRDAKGRRVGSGKQKLAAPFDPTSWGHRQSQGAAAQPGLENLPLMLTQPDRNRIKVPRRARVVELSSSVPSLIKVSARLSASQNPAPLDPTFAQISLGKMKWALAPRATRNWSTLRAQELDLTDLVDVESQLHLELRPPRDPRASSAGWKTLEPQGRSTRQEVLEQVRASSPCSSCWYELAADIGYVVRGSASLRRGAKVLMDMGTPASAAQLAGCGFNVDGARVGYRCPVFRGTQSVPELGAGNHQVSWTKGPSAARLWVNQPSSAINGKRAARSFKRRTLHELAPGEALDLAWDKAEGEASRVHVDVYVPQGSGRGGASVLEAQLRKGAGPWTSKEKTKAQSLRGKRIVRGVELRFLNDTHSGTFSVYRFVIDVDDDRSAGTYKVAFSPVSQGKLWIRAINRM